jgi:hypothetical protein
MSLELSKTQASIFILFWNFLLNLNKFVDQIYLIVNIASTKCLRWKKG